MTDIRDPEQTSDAEFVQALQGEVNSFYKRLFHMNVGGRFHAFLEWCGVMGEHLNIVGDLVQQGHDPFDMNRHTGRTLPVAPFRMDYLAEKMECIFDGAVEVHPVRSEAETADLSTRIHAAVSEQVERSTKATHHHATRKALARDIAASVMQQLASAPLAPHAPDLARRLREGTARMAMPVPSEAARQELTTAVLEAARMLEGRQTVHDEGKNR